MIIMQHTIIITQYHSIKIFVFKKTMQRNKLPSKESMMDFLRFQLSGIIGTLVFYLIYEFFNLLSVATHPTTAWFFSYLCSIFFQFELHRLIVFRHWEEQKSQQTILPLGPVTPSTKSSKPSYLSQLLQCYLLYSISLVLSTVLNYVMISLFGFHHRLTWFFSLVLCGIINYF